jgi:glycosyltransferase involved in cell wall biosynthesis
MQKVTAIIPTFNEEHNIEAALASVSWADEIIVVDSFSTDNTVKIAEDKGAKVIQRTYGHSASQKNWAIPQAQYEWIFLLDADERVEDQLKTEVQSILTSKENKHVAFWIKRRNFFMGSEIKYSGWQGDKVIRLFKRDECRYEDKSVHAEVLCKGSVGILKNQLIHYTFKDIFHYLEKWDRYTTMSGTDRANRGEKPTLFHFLVKPGFRFFQDYFLKLGFLDGITGFILCSLSSMSVFMRYLKVKQFNQDKNKAI